MVGAAGLAGAVLATLAGLAACALLTWLAGRTDSERDPAPEAVPAPRGNEGAPELERSGAALSAGTR
jgi:hypothetical protein